jgi:hypothetical protein
MAHHSCLTILRLATAVTLAGCGGKTATVTISNKITSLPAGQFYKFDVALQHTQGLGATWALNGQGTLVSPPESKNKAIYIAPPTPPVPNSVTVTATAANGSGVSDSDTFTITGAPGPIVSISPASFTAAAHGSPVPLSISVTQDNPSDALTGSVSDCGGACGSLGPFMGTTGGGSYTLQFSPPSTTVTQPSTQSIQVSSSLANSTSGIAFVIINPG